MLGMRISISEVRLAKTELSFDTVDNHEFVASLIPSCICMSYTTVAYAFIAESEITYLAWNPQVCNDGNEDR